MVHPIALLLLYKNTNTWRFPKMVLPANHPFIDGFAGIPTAPAASDTIDLSSRVSQPTSSMAMKCGQFMSILSADEGAEGTNDFGTRNREI